MADSKEKESKAALAGEYEDLLDGASTFNQRKIWSCTESEIFDLQTCLSCAFICTTVDVSLQMLWLILQARPSPRKIRRKILQQSMAADLNFPLRSRGNRSPKRTFHELLMR